MEHKSVGEHVLYLGDPPQQRHELAAVAHTQRERVAPGLERLELLPDLDRKHNGDTRVDMRRA